MNLEKLKLVARQHEGREEWRKAIDVYLKAIEAFESGEAPVPDLSLYNRVGDLYMKINSTGSAVQSYERAVDLYSDQGLANNAIALCGKILRVNPGRVQVYLKLAKLHAMKNVVVEAQKNLLEYLDRMNSSGHREEALGEVTAFAERFAANEDIRAMLTELLRAASRRQDAPEHLERLAEDIESGSPTPAPGSQAASPSADRPRARPSLSPKPGDLIFLDTGIDFQHLGIRTPLRRGEAHEAPAEAGVGGGTVDSEADSSSEVEAAEPVPSDEEAPYAQADAEMAGEPEELEEVEEELVIQRHVYDDVPTTEASTVSEGLELEPTAVEDVDEAPVDRLDGLMVDSAAELRSDTVEPVKGLEDLAIEHGPAEEPIEPDTSLIDADAGLDGVEVSAADSLVAPTTSQADDLGAEVMADEAEAEPAADAGSTLTAPTIADLEDRILDDPDDPWAHRALGEALIADGQAGRGLEELELALQGYEGEEDWGHASDVVGELVRLDPNCIAYYQKGVELAFRIQDLGRLLDSYLALGDVLVRVGALDKAAAVYGRVLEHDPGHMMAQAALESLAPVEEEPPRPAPTAPPAPAVTPSPPAAEQKDFVHLGDLVMDQKSKDARIRIDRTQPTGDEAQDFAEILQEFRRGIDENIEIEDYQSHYDLGIAFKEMGLLDEAIAEFQKALRAPQGRLPTSEALGVSFFEKEQFPVAEAILKRAVDALPGLDDEKIGLLYWLGRAREEQGKVPEALTCYQRAMAVDISFMDIGERVLRLEESLPR